MNNLCVKHAANFDKPSNSRDTVAFLKIKERTRATKIVYKI